MNCKLSATALAVFALYLVRAAPAQKAYTSYEILEAWRSLVPELHQARVCNLTVVGHELWAQGQLRMPEETFLRGDFRHTGVEDWAVPLVDGGDTSPCAYVLLTTRNAGGWQRLLLQPVALEDSLSGFSLLWNEREQAIGLDFGKRKRVTSPATLVWQDGLVVEAKAGYVLEFALISQIINWVGKHNRLEYRRVASPEEWDAVRPS